MRWAAGALVLAAVAAGAGCSGDGDVRQFDSYVAIGDSFTSGSGLPRADPATGVCGNSPLSYPHLVAKDVGATLTDASCGGATTDNGTQPQGDDAAPQLAAVRADTEL